MLYDKTRRESYENRAKNMNKFLEIKMWFSLEKKKRVENNVKNTSQTTEQKE